MWDAIWNWVMDRTAWLLDKFMWCMEKAGEVLSTLITTIGEWFS